MRAIERAQAGEPGTGGLLSAERPPYDALVIGLTAERQTLYERVDERIDRMVEQGWAAEVRGLLAAGVGRRRTRNVCDRIPGHGAPRSGRDHPGRVEKPPCRKASRTLVRRQYNWFKMTDPRIAWFEAGPDAASSACELTAGWLQMDNLPRIGVEGDLAPVP